MPTRFCAYQGITAIIPQKQPPLKTKAFPRFPIGRKSPVAGAGFGLAGHCAPKIRLGAPTLSALDAKKRLKLRFFSKKTSSGSLRRRKKWPFSSYVIDLFRFAG